MDRILKVLFNNNKSTIFVLDYEKHIIKFLKFIFIAYTIFLSNKLLFDSNRLLAREILISNRDIYLNLVPFKTISRYFEYFSYFKFWDWMSNMLGNVLIFVPIGLLLPIISGKRKSFIYCIGIGMIMSLTVEIAQHFLGLGVFDVDDIILNVFGVLSGFVFYKIIRRLILYR